MDTAHFFQRLPGIWTINRSISGYARMQGEASFSQIKANANALHYHEQGTLTLEGSQKTLACYQDYVYRYQNEQKVISVHFVEEGNTDRWFHTLRFSTANEISTAEGNHLCNQDIYLAVYKSIDKDHFEVIYKVKGPKKDYESHTFFRR